jgi:hypothetical protein
MLSVEIFPRLVVIVEPVSDDTIIKELTTNVEPVKEEIPKPVPSSDDTFKDDTLFVII